MWSVKELVFDQQTGAKLEGPVEQVLDPVVVNERVQQRAVTAQKLIVLPGEVVECEPDAAYVATEKSSGG